MSRSQVNDKRDYYRNSYLLSDHWKERRARKLGSNPVCEICGTNQALDVHHIHYRDLYDVTGRDLIVLCRKHHDMLHHGLATLKGRVKEAALEHRLDLMIMLARDLNAQGFEERK